MDAGAVVPESWILRPASRDLLVCAQPDAQPGDVTSGQLFATDAELASPTLSIRVPVAVLFEEAL